MTKKDLRLGILVSGNGSNLQAIINACEQKKIPAQVAVVLSNNKNAFALQRAAKHHIPAFIVSNEAGMEQEIAKHLQDHKIDLICLAGFMRLLSSAFVKKWEHRIINIHPALLPSFPGLHAQKQALDDGAKFSGATVHFVDAGCDTGPIILQEAVAIETDETEESLTKKIRAVEHRLYVEAIELIANESLKIVGRRVLRK